VKKQDAIRILFKELGKRKAAQAQEDRQPVDEVAEALETILDEVVN